MLKDQAWSKTTHNGLNFEGSFYSQVISSDSQSAEHKQPPDDLLRDTHLFFLHGNSSVNILKHYARQ